VLRVHSVETPIGTLLLARDEAGLTRVDFQEPPETRSTDSLLLEAAGQLRAYFAGELIDFDLALAPEGTPFQRRVWQRLTEIPYGSTATYGELARELGLPRGARAVGAANAVNPVPVILPCHRVVASSGDLAGYGLGGRERKRQLLRLESGQLTLTRPPAPEPIARAGSGQLDARVLAAEGGGAQAVAILGKAADDLEEDGA
jgi:methylated-DNA-[protein]-cysteine S-methyltransferase